MLFIVGMCCLLAVYVVYCWYVFFIVGMCCLLLVCVVYCWYVLFIDGMCCLLLVCVVSDYIRTFTWDKKLEMVVKTTYSQLGGQGMMV